MVRGPRVRPLRARRASTVGRGRSGRRHEASCRTVDPRGAGRGVGDNAEGAADAGGADPVRGRRGHAGDVSPRFARRPDDAFRVRISVVVPRSRGAGRTASVWLRRRAGVSFRRTAVRARCSAVLVRDGRLLGEARGLRAATVEAARASEQEEDRRRRRTNARDLFLHDRILVASRRPQTSLAERRRSGRRGVRLKLGLGP